MLSVRVVLYDVASFTTKELSANELGAMLKKSCAFRALTNPLNGVLEIIVALTETGPGSAYDEL
jgi:hypothetical protein